MSERDAGKDATDRPRAGTRLTPLLVAVVAAAIVVALQCFVLSRFDWRPSALMLIGEDQIASEAGDTEPLFLREFFPADTVVYDSGDGNQNASGYDGSLYYVVAQDPLRLDDDFAGDFKRRQLFRYQRMLAPLIVWALARGDAAAVPLAFMVTNVIAIFVAAWALAALLRTQGRTNWWALAGALSPGLVFSAVYPMTEPVCIAFVALALLAYRRDRHVGAVACFALALLTRESAVLFLGGVGLGELLARRPRRCAFYVLAVLPFFAWQAYLWIDAGTAALGQSGFALTWPFAGMAAMGEFFKGAAGARLVAQCAAAAFAAWLVFLAAFGAGARITRKDPLGVVLAARAGVNAFFYSDFFSTFVNVTRTNAGLGALAVLLARKRRWPDRIALAGAVAFAALGIARILLKADAPYFLL